MNKVLAAVFAAIMVMQFPAFSAIGFQHGVAKVNGICDAISWVDKDGRTRTAYLLNDTTQSFYGAPTGGNMQCYEWNNGSATKACNAIGDLYAGWGFTVNHGGFSHRAWMDSKEDGYTPHSHMVFTGDHHAIWEFTCKLGTHGINTTPYVLLTIQYVFKDGEDHFQHITCFNSSQIANPSSVAGLLGSDSRSPYGALNWDGDNGTISKKTGIGEGMTNIIKGDLTAMTWQNQTLSSGGYNLCPYVEAWRTDNGYDDEIGYVQTRLMTNHWAGRPGCQVNQSASGSISGTDIFDVQFMDFQGWYGERTCWEASGPTGNGQIGVTPGYENYSLSVIIDRRSTAGLQRLVDEANAIMNAGTSLSATTGTVVTQGIESPGCPVLRAWDKPGFDQVYRNWVVQGSNNRIAATLAIQSGKTLLNPTFVVAGYTASTKPVVKKNGTTLVEGTGYYASVIPDRQEAWVTYLSPFAGSTAVAIEGGASATGLSITNFTVTPNLVENSAATPVTFTATVTDNQSVAGVTLDLSAIGGGSAVAMTGSGSTYSCTYTIPAGTVGGGAMLVTLRASDGSGNFATAVTGVTVKVPDLIIYRGSVDKAVAGWEPGGTFTKTSADNPYEGTEHIKLAYNGTGTLGDIAFNASCDLTPYKYLIIAMRGPAAGQNLGFELRAGSVNAGSGMRNFGNHSAYTVLSIPLGDFPIDQTNIGGIRTEITGGSGAGAVYLDNIYFSISPASSTSSPPTASVSVVASRMPLLPALSVRGRTIVASNVTAASLFTLGGTKLATTGIRDGSVMLTAPSAGVYVVKLTNKNGSMSRTLTTR